MIKLHIDYDKIIPTMQAQLRLQPQWRKWLARWALHIGTKVVGLSLTQIAFFLENTGIPNSILLLILDYGLGYAIYNVLKFFVHCKPMITNRGHSRNRPKGGRNSPQRYTSTRLADHFSQRVQKPLQRTIPAVNC